MMNLNDIRREYLQGGLNQEDLTSTPFELFELWLQQAIDAGLKDPTAMTLATVSEDGQPSQRIVLLKESDDKGFVFFTNLSSTKAQNIAVNNKVSIHFPWHGMERQVKVCGTAEKLPTSQVLKYFLTRPKESQIAAWASKQSSPLSSRQLLMSQFDKIKQRFSDGEVPLPDFWGGYRVVPHEIEFWQGGEHRLHDRFVYSLQEEGKWATERLAP